LVTSVNLAAGMHSLTARYSGEGAVVDSFGTIAHDDPSTSAPVAEVVGLVDVTSQVRVTFGSPQAVNGTSNHFQVSVTLRNIGTTAIPGALSLVLDGLPAGVTLISPTPGFTQAHSPNGHPYVRLNVGQLDPGASTSVTLVFSASNLTLLSGVHVSTRVFDGDGTI
jgi:hypothetical protein